MLIGRARRMGANYAFVVVSVAFLALLVFGWVVAGHQVGAASATVFAGLLRTVQGNYIQAFAFAGATGVLAALISLAIGRRSLPQTA